MRRRQFIEVATAAVLLPAVARSMGTSLPLPGTVDYTFFDERFPQAVRLVASWPDARKQVAVQADVTPFWGEGLDRLGAQRPLSLRGVTVDSFRFCLMTLMRESAHVEVHAARLDRNLFVWALSTVPKHDGKTPWQHLSRPA